MTSRLAVVAGLLASASATALTLAHRRFSAQVRVDVQALLARARPASPGVVTDDRLRELPPPVRRYLTYVGIVGKPLVSAVRLKQTGAMRASPEGQWVPLKAEQYYTVDPPGFVWSGAMHLGPLALVRAHDTYLDGAGHMLVKAASLYPIADARGPEMDQGGLTRYLSEMIWFPTAFLGDNVTFEAIDDASARVTLTDNGRSVSGTMSVDREGKLVEFLAKRYRAVDGGYELDWWSTPAIAYGTLGGLNLPDRGQAIWKLTSGDFAYIDVTVRELEYAADDVTLSSFRRLAGPADTRRPG